jgi:hypothetical protein
MPEMLDNISKTVKDDLVVAIKKGAKDVRSGGVFFDIRLLSPQKAT